MVAAVRRRLPRSAQSRALPLGVFALALLPRLWRIDLTQFYDDPVRHIAAAARFVDTGRLPLSSGLPFSVGNLNEPPLVTYLFALPVLLTRDPVWLSAVTACVDALAAVVVALLARKLTGRGWVGLIAGALYAFNASAITFGRTFYTPALVPLCTAGALLALVDFWQSRRAWSLGAAVFAVGWAAQLHVVNAIFFAVAAAVAALHWRKLRPLPLLVGAALALLPLAPYLYLQATTGWADMAAFVRYSQQPKASDFAALDTLAALGGPVGFDWWTQPGGGSSLPIWLVTWLLAGLAVVGLAAAVRRWRRGDWILAVWLLLPVLATLRRVAPAQPIDRHYLLGVLPALVALQGLGCAEVHRLLAGGAERRFGPGAKRRSTAVAAALFVALMAALGGAYAGFLRTIDTSTREVEFGVPLRYSQLAGAAVHRLVGEQPLWIATPYYNAEVVPSLAGRRSAYDWHWDHTAFVFPRSSGWFLAQNGNFGWRFLSEHFSPAVSTVVNGAGLPEYRLFRLDAAAPHRLLNAPGFARVGAAAGPALRLEGYLPGILAAGQPSSVTFLWRVLDPTRAPEHLNQFAHLVDAAGHTVSRDPDVYDLRETWTAGDLVATEVDLDVAPDTPTEGCWLETGFYGTFDHQPVGEPIRIGPMKVVGAATTVAGAPRAVFGEGEIGLTKVDWQGTAVGIDWTALAKPRASYTVFVHAVDSAGKLVAQWDGLPRGGSYPTSLWDAGEVVHDSYDLGLPPAPGVHLEIGLYTQPDVRRLPVRVPGSTAVADHLTIGEDALRPV